MIGIIDYGAGNLQSVKNAFDRLSVETEFVAERDKFSKYTGLVLPGVGSFGEAMRQLENRGLALAIAQWAGNNLPLFGICLGLQLMFETSEESEEAKGLGIFEGSVNRIPDCKGLKIPHIGWNELNVVNKYGIFSQVDTGEYFYFVHSYYVNPKNKDIVSATTNYGIDIPVAVRQGNISACQFHPEKSGDNGIKMLAQFCRICGEEAKC